MDFAKTLCGQRMHIIFKFVVSYFQVTILNIVPSLLLIIDKWDEEKFSQLSCMRYIFVGSSKTNPRLVKTVAEKSKIKIIERKC